MSRARSLRPVWRWLLLFGIPPLLNLPFIDKAFHIDDPGFLKLSRTIGWNPLHAIPIDYDVAGTVVPGVLPYEMPHPLLVPYFIKIVTALFGEHEVALHVAFMIFPVLALWSLIRLNAVLFGDSPSAGALVALLFCSMPAFLVNSQNIMADVPTVAFLLLATAAILEGLDRGSLRMTYLGGGALTLAIFCSYQALAFVPLIFLYAWWTRTLGLHVALALATPCAALLAWLLAVYAMYDLVPILKTRLHATGVDVAGLIAQGLAPDILLRKTLSVLAFVGAAMAWVIPLHYVLRQSSKRLLVLFLALLVISHLTTSPLTGYPLVTNALLSGFVALGVLTLLTISSSAWQRMRPETAAREAFLLVWVLGVMGYTIVLLPFSAARYLLPAFPPALMLLLNDPAWRFTTRARRIGLSCVLGGTLLFGLASAISDYEYALVYRDFAVRARTLPAAESPGRVWYIGAWGMDYYMAKAGARYLHAASNEPAPGDVVVYGEMVGFWSPSTQVQRRMTAGPRVPYRSWLPLRLFNVWSHAGFYSHGWGLLPFAFSAEPDEIFHAFTIVR